MNKWRVTLVIALLAVLAAATGLWLVPFWLAKAAAVFLGCVALGLAINLIFTIFAIKEAQDPWDTTYFKYMRALWGDLWGGPEYTDKWGYKKEKRLLQIDTCRANHLAMWTGLAWLMLISAVGFAVYLSIYALAAGTMPSFLSYAKPLPSLILFTLTVGSALSGFSILVLFISNNVGKVYPRFRKRVIITWLLSLCATNAVSLIVLPISEFGLIKFLINQTIQKAPLKQRSLFCLLIY